MRALALTLHQRGMSAESSQPRRGRTSETSRPRRAVMSDVGRLAGVSHQTVSRVINGSPHVRPETRERVLKAMLELGYRPNFLARALVTGRSRTLGVVSFDTTLYGPASTLLGIEHAAHEEDYFIIVASALFPNLFGRVMRMFNRCLPARVSQSGNESRSGVEIRSGK